jgi:hypothetical protein
MRIRRMAIPFVFFLLGLPFSCITPCGSGEGSPELQIFEFEVQTGYYSEPNSQGLIFPPELDSTEVLNFEDVFYELFAKDLMEASVLPSRNSGFAAYACSPAPRVSVDSISSIEVTSQDTLWFNNSNILPGSPLNELITPKYYSSWLEFYNVSKYEIIDYGLTLIISQKPDRLQPIELNFRILMEDGRELSTNSYPITVE